MSYTLHTGDCLDIMRGMAAQSVDAVICDPPFNAGKEFANDHLTPKDFQAFCNRFALELYRLKPENILVEVGKNDSIMRGEIERYFDYKYAICLNCTNSMRNGAIGYANWGLVLWFSNGGKCHKRYKDRLDSAVHNTKGLFSHPSPKETDHYQHLVRMFTPTGSTVLDPFMGSGTTGLACVAEGRDFIGIDITPEYVDIARQRLAQATQQMPLLAD